MNSTIATFLDRHNWKHSGNIFLICWLICSCDRKTFTKYLLDKLFGYRFIQCNEFKAPNESSKDESLLEKFVWGQKKMLCNGAANMNNFLINESWVQQNTERAFFYQFFTLNYQYFNKVNQQPDAESKKWAIVPTSSHARQNIVINNEILHYIGKHVRYFENKNLGKLQVLVKGSLKSKTLKDNMMKMTGFHKVLWDVMFHSNIQDVLKLTTTKVGPILLCFMVVQKSFDNERYQRWRCANKSNAEVGQRSF